MGNCCSSESPVNGDGGKPNNRRHEPTSGDGSSPPSSPSNKRKVDLFLASVVPSFAKFVRGRKNKQHSQRLLKIFLKTVCNFTHATQRTSLEEARRVVLGLHDDFAVLREESVEERCSDEGLTRVLEAWTHLNDANCVEIDKDVALQMLKELDVHIASVASSAPFKNKSKISFDSILACYYDAVCLPTTLAVFREMFNSAVAAANNNNNNSNNSHAPDNSSSGNNVVPGSGASTGSNAATTGGSGPSAEIIIVQNLLTDGRLHHEASSVDITTARDFLHRHFGGAIVEENFCAFCHSHKSNGVFDSRSVTSVWQDMTQPLPNYLINSQSVASEADVNLAFSNNVRAFLLQLQFHDHNHSVTVGPKLPLAQFCEAIRDRGFKKNSFPIIMILPPWKDAPMTPAQEELVATVLTETLGPMLAKGLMFRGATIRDPEFSPATLRHKVLLMSAQAKLNPFVGLFVADMARPGLGVRVTDVKNASPAASAGVAKDDWITRINQDTIEDKQHLRKCLSTFRIGEEFTVTRENLSHARVVVGAAVDANDRKHSSSLSNLIFFNFTASPVVGAAAGGGRGGSNNKPAVVPMAVVAGSPVTAATNGSQYAPWETSIITQNDLSKSTRPVDHLALVQSPSREHEPAANNKASTANGNGGNGGGAGAHPQKTPTKGEPSSNNSNNSDENSDKRRKDEDSLVAIEQFGAQLVDAQASRAAEQWSRGTFVVNGHCGYVLRDTLETSRKMTESWSFKIVSAPFDFKDAELSRVTATVFGSDSVATHHARGGDDAAADHEGADANAQKYEIDENKNTEGGGAGAGVGAGGSNNNISGDGDDRPHWLWHFTITATLHSRLAITMQFQDGRKLEAVLPAHLLRSGLRAVPFRLVDGYPGYDEDVLCIVEHHSITPSNSSPA